MRGFCLLATVVFCCTCWLAPSAVAQLAYEGAIAPTVYHYTAPRFDYSRGGLTYSRDCFGRADPSPADRFPGCLGMIGHPNYAPLQFGAFSVEAPQHVVEQERSARNYPPGIAVGKEVIPMMDPSLDADGNSIFLDLAESALDWTNRELHGVEVLPDGTLLHVCAHDWYNAGQRDFPSHCLARFTEPGEPMALGPFSFSCVPPYEALCRTQQIGAYVGVVGDQGFADEVFAAAGFSDPGDAICLSGMIREPGSNAKWSQGTSLYAFRCADMSRGRSDSIAAVPLIHHPGPEGDFSQRHNVNVVSWPRYSSIYRWSPWSKCEDIAWGEYPSADGGRLQQGLFVACRFGGPVWWYGTQKPWQDPEAHRYVLDGTDTCLFNAGSPQTSGGQDCRREFDAAGDAIPRDFIDECNIDKGYHGVFAQPPHTRAVVLFYRAADIAASARASLRGQAGSHLSTLPFEIVVDTPATLWDAKCAEFAGIAFDAADKRLFVVEKNQGLPVIHTYSVARAGGAPLLSDGFENAD